MKRSPARIARTERWLTLAAIPSTFDEICTEQASGRGLVVWCKERDVRYLDVSAWIDDDPERSRIYAIACAARGAATATQLESLISRTISGNVDPRAAGVAAKSLQWLASVYDRKRFGEQMRVDHRHSLGEDHIAVLKQLGASSLGGTHDSASSVGGSANGFQSAPHSAQASATREALPPPIDAEFSVTPSLPRREEAQRSAQPVDRQSVFDV